MDLMIKNRKKVPENPKYTGKVRIFLTFCSQIVMIMMIFLKKNFQDLFDFFSKLLWIIWNVEKILVSDKTIICIILQLLQNFSTTKFSLNICIFSEEGTDEEDADHNDDNDDDYVTDEEGEEHWDKLNQQIGDYVTDDREETSETNTQMINMRKAGRLR